MIERLRACTIAVAGWEQRLTIRARLALLALSVALPFAVYLVFSTDRQAEDERAQVAQRLLGVARVTTARLDDYVGDVRQLLVVLAQVVQVTNSGTGANDALLEQIGSQLPPQINNLIVYDTEGRNIGSLYPGLRSNAPSTTRKKFFDKAMQDDRLTVEAPVVSAATGQPVALFGLAIKREGRVVGIVVASMRLDALQSLLSAEGTLPREAVITVLDDAGVVVARSLDPVKWIGKVMQRKGDRDGVRMGRNADGIDRIGAFSTAQRVSWLVYVGVPTDVALQAARKHVVEGLLAGLAMLFAGLVAAATLGRRISAPLVQLAADAAVLEGGDLGHRSAGRQGGEIGALRSALNRMAQTLQERAASLLASQTQLREITNNLPVLISYLDRDRRFRFANKTYGDWFGIDPETLIGKTLEEVFGAPTYALIEDHVTQGLRGQHVRYERVMNSLSGPRQVEVTMVPHVETEVEGLFVLIQDVTQNRDAAVARRKSEERLGLALEGSGAALFDWDIERDLMFHSAQAAIQRGEPAREETGPSAEFHRWVHLDDRADLVAAVKATVLGEREHYDAEFRVASRTGEWIWLRGRGRVVERDPSGRALRLAGTYTDITQLKTAENQLKQLAQYDSLTGLPNRALFLDRLTRALARHSRSTTAGAVLFLDIDHFKSVNDTLGHEAGDRLLVDFAQTLRDSVRATDTVARLAGDEFTIILEGLHEPSDAVAVAAKVLAQSRRTLGAGALKVSTSIGIAMMDSADLDPHAILRRADLALYAAKRAGRDRLWMANAESVPESVL